MRNENRYSTNGEYFAYDNIHDTLDSATYDNEKIGDTVTIYEGELEQYPASHYLIEVTTESLNEEAYDTVGEYADEWPNLTKSQEKELNVEINKTVDLWFSKQKLHPSFGAIENVKELKYKITDLEDVDNWELLNEQ